MSRCTPVDTPIDATRPRRQRHHRERRLGTLTVDHDCRFPEIELGFARRMRQPNEHLAPMPLRLGDVAADLHLAAPITMPVAQPMENPPRGVPLLRGRVSIRSQDLVDHPDERAELGQRPPNAGPIPRRLNMLKDLVERPPTHLVITTDLALRDPLDEHLASDLRPQLHVCAHPSPVRSPDPLRKPQGEPASERGSSGAVVFDDHKPITGAAVFDERLQVPRNEPAVPADHRRRLHDQHDLRQP